MAILIGTETGKVGCDRPRKMTDEFLLIAAELQGFPLDQETILELIHRGLLTVLRERVARTPQPGSEQDH